MDQKGWRSGDGVRDVSHAAKQIVKAGGRDREA